MPACRMHLVREAGGGVGTAMPDASMQAGSPGKRLGRDKVECSESH